MGTMRSSKLMPPSIINSVFNRDSCRMKSACESIVPLTELV